MSNITFLKIPICYAVTDVSMDSRGQAVLLAMFAPVALDNILASNCMFCMTSHCVCRSTRNFLAFGTVIQFRFTVYSCGVVRGSSVGIATRQGLYRLRIDFRWGRDCPHPSRPAVGPIPSPVQWVLGL
jgi:hypothetical protein